MNDQQSITQNSINNFATISAAWWHTNIANRALSQHRALAAKLRRIDNPVEALMEQEVCEYVKNIRTNSSNIPIEKVVAVACILAMIRENTPNETMARHMGRKNGDKPIVSNARFQKLIRAEDDDLLHQMQYIIKMCGNSCNVGSLASDLLKWNDKIKAKWCLEYFA